MSIFFRFGIGASILIGQQIQCLPYAVFFYLSAYLSMYLTCNPDFDNFAWHMWPIPFSLVILLVSKTWNYK